MQSLYQKGTCTCSTHPSPHSCSVLSDMVNVTHYVCYIVCSYQYTVILECITCIIEMLTILLIKIDTVACTCGIVGPNQKHQSQDQNERRAWKHSNSTATNYHALSSCGLLPFLYFNSSCCCNHL